MYSLGFDDTSGNQILSEFHIARFSMSIYSRIFVFTVPRNGRPCLCLSWSPTENNLVSFTYHALMCNFLSTGRWFSVICTSMHVLDVKYQWQWTIRKVGPIQL